MMSTIQEVMSVYIVREARVQVYKSFSGSDSFELLLIRQPPFRLKTDPPAQNPKPFAKLLVARPVNRFGDYRTDAIAHCHLLGPGGRPIGPPFGFRIHLDESLVPKELIDAIIELRGDEKPGD